MSDDILKRLEYAIDHHYFEGDSCKDDGSFAGLFHGSNPERCYSSVMEDAAKEIARLRNALQLGQEVR